MEKLPKEQELLQMPGRGDLDFGPLIRCDGEDQLSRLDIDLHASCPARNSDPRDDRQVTDEINRDRTIDRIAATQQRTPSTMH